MHNAACVYIKLQTLNSGIGKELHDRKVEGRTNATTYA